MRISNQDSDKLEYTIGFFSRDSQTFTTDDLARSISTTQVAPRMFKPAAGLHYQTPNKACNAARAAPSEAFRPPAGISV